MRESEKITHPYELELIREDSRLVEVQIRTTGEELDYATLNAAIRVLTDRVRSEQVRQRRLPLGASSLRNAVAEFDSGKGRITDRYLAALAVAYAELSETPGAPVMATLANALGRPAASIKGHVGRARKEGFLTEAETTRPGGSATKKATELLAD